MGRARLVVAAIIALFAIITYFGSTSENPLTGEKQRVAMTPEQEIRLGYQSAPQMAAQMGGESRNAQALALVQRGGEGLLRQLKTEGELAGVLGHEIGHVIARHSSEHLAKQQLTQGLLGALVVGSGDYTTAQIGQMVGSMINVKYGREDELEADALGIRIMVEAGYDPR